METEASSPTAEINVKISLPSLGQLYVLQYSEAFSGADKKLKTVILNDFSALIRNQKSNSPALCSVGKKLKKSNSAALSGVNKN